MNRLFTIIFCTTVLVLGGMYCLHALIRDQALQYFSEAPIRIIYVVGLALGGGLLTWWSGSRKPDVKQKHILAWWGLFNAFLFCAALYFTLAVVRLILFSQSETPIVAAEAVKQLPVVIVYLDFAVILLATSMHFMIRKWKLRTSQNNMPEATQTSFSGFQQGTNTSVMAKDRIGVSTIRWLAIGIATFLAAAVFTIIIVKRLSRTEIVVYQLPGKKIADPNWDGWTHLQKGMSKDEVIALLGDSESKVIVPEKIRYVRFDDGRVLAALETWEYAWTDSISSAKIGAHSQYAYTVYFDSGGKLASWAAPSKRPPNRSRGK